MTTLYLQLGRAGDILAVLPFLRQLPERPKLMVAKEYAPVLEGVSYVEPVIFDGPHHDLEAAFAQAQGLADRIICTQVNGPRESVDKLVYSQNRTAMASSLPLFITRVEWAIREEVIDVLKEAKDDGRSMTWCAKELGVSRQTLYSWFEKLKIDKSYANDLRHE